LRQGPAKGKHPAAGRAVLSTGNTSYIAVPGPRGGVVTQRTANPRTPVQFRAWPPLSRLDRFRGETRKEQPQAFFATAVVFCYSPAAINDSSIPW
jgi:hypothetical protein